MSNITQTKSDHSFRADIETEDGVKREQMCCYNGHYLDHVDFVKDRHVRDDEILQRGCLLETTFAYAITCHKAQGSQFGSIIIVDDWKRNPQHRRWMYTAITRAVDAVVILT